MSKLLDTLYAMIASSIVLLVRTSQEPSVKYTFIEVWVLPIVLALIVYIVLQAITHFIKSMNRPLKKYEGYWIEIIEDPAIRRHTKYISILELLYVDNSYSIRGSTFLPDATSVATWRADRTHLYDKQNKLLDYIYTADINNKDFSETTVRGYATIDFKSKQGYIIDIMSEDNKKQNFKLTNQIKKSSNIESLPYNKKLKTELERFISSK